MKTKRIVSLALILMLVCSLGVIEASANNSACGGDGEVPGAAKQLTYDEQLREIENDDSLTEAQKEQGRIKIEFMKELALLNANTRMTDSQISAQKQKLFDDFNAELLSLASSEPVIGTMAVTYGSLGVPYCKQENGFYCGPATVRQTLGYYNGLANAPTQVQVAKDLKVVKGVGTPDAKLMRNYINARLTSMMYIEVTNPTENDMQNWLAGAQARRCPIILRMANQNDPKKEIWPYQTDGHYLNVSGQIGAARFELTDPNIGRVDPSITTGKYQKTTKEIHNVTIQHHQKSFWH